LSIAVIRRNERRKLSAAWCNAAASGLLTVGAFAPIVAGLVGVGQSPGVFVLLSTVLGALAISVCLHLAGRQMLERLEA
jgi:hypothetical protein